MFLCHTKLILANINNMYAFFVKRNIYSLKVFIENSLINLCMITLYIYIYIYIYNFGHGYACMSRYNIDVVRKEIKRAFCGTIIYKGKKGEKNIILCIDSQDKE